MIVRDAHFYRKLIEHSAQMPITANNLIMDRLELVRSQIIDKSKQKHNLIQVYAVGCGFSIFQTVINGSVIAIFMAILLCSFVVIIIEDLIELQNMEPSVDQLRDINNGGTNPAPTGPFWY